MLKIGYFADGKWARICLLKILQNPQIQINFIVLRKTKDTKLEKLALRYQIPCYTHIDVNSKEFLNELEKYSNDLLVSMSFDQIFKEELLKLYPRKIINCHAGKLPFYRGRNILNWALINDEKEFGISVHFIDKGIDTGDIILQKTYDIKDSDDYTTLLNLCHKECASLLYESLILFLEDNVKAYKQKEGGFYCPKRKKGDEIINWTQSTREIFNFIRALNAKDLGASAFIDKKEIKIYKSEIYKDKIFNAPIGKIVKKEKNFFIVSTKDGALKITKFKGMINMQEKFKIDRGGGI
ncbi:methionyl-tRNA formyltransferase [Campylobacter jejuni]|uniref:Methionyl-tRNA formyltransferase n=2 Tax=Campylobacter jejuni TaxID=197 RepID=A0AB36G119_CAMJU|nr:methionyl-tRNA formyltransferase [Campylobacter jejuni]EBH4142691.1 methionyl-tRNA formyltransferase [Campylobacter jejuni]EIY3538225.1 methionyl-tRNA formyltransferase [Campylobacter jejuni]EKS3202386.1 methionyl-tRNA formyltransferase [Campylobacter jejuni]EMA2810087.1 methionyl-tRNA formyltransferase [Campylobacter jejuni]OEV44577.1 methionyl-tRNA formyltransferase [Campylobacter jejuni]